MPSPPARVYAVGRLPSLPPSFGRNRRLIYERSCHKLNEKSSAGEIIDDPVASACRREGVPRGKKEGMAGKRQDWLQRSGIAGPIYKSSSRCLVRSRSVATVDRPRCGRRRGERARAASALGSISININYPSHYNHTPATVGSVGGARRGTAEPRGAGDEPRDSRVSPGVAYARKTRVRFTKLGPLASLLSILAKMGFV